jgi:hypothetical protein
VAVHDVDVEALDAVVDEKIQVLLQVQEIGTHQ